MLEDMGSLTFEFIMGKLLGNLIEAIVFLFKKESLFDIFTVFSENF